MPKVRTQFSLLLFLTSILAASVFAQTPTVADVLQNRITNAKAQLIVKNYSAAIWELENIRRESNDRAVDRMASVLLMNAYLEQGNFKEAQNFLKELGNEKDQIGAEDFIAVGSQVTSGAKTLLKRYQSLGLKVTDKDLPKYAKDDLDEMRQTLELVIDESKDIGKYQAVQQNAMALLEEASTARSGLARDSYDAKRWENELSYAREQLANSGSRIVNAVAGTNPTEIVDGNEIAETDEPIEDDKVELVLTPKSEIDAEKVESKEAEMPLAVDRAIPTDRKVVIVPSAEKTPLQVKEKAESPDAPDAKVLAEEKSEKKETDDEEDVTTKTEPPADVAATAETEVDPDSPVTVGSLVTYATKRVNPVYPRQARTMRMSGVVKVELMVDEDGNVASIKKMDGPTLLKRAAEDAIRKWQFKPFVRDGQPVKATGFVSFNFNL